MSQLLKLDLFLQLKCFAIDSFQSWGVSEMFQGASMEEEKKEPFLICTLMHWVYLLKGLKYKAALLQKLIARWGVR